MTEAKDWLEELMGSSFPAWENLFERILLNLGLQMNLEGSHIALTSARIWV